ncbi:MULTISPECIES: YhgE/Pip domain-containing protein [Microbacterium]|uniref:YhgE/Pip domain-containing protein n=1 Tax=Microbacterium TaxID=33882 RepID=UPI00277F9E12|nr:MULTISPECIES: YhgE/Pip domain-containing protein [Microbacterium]MDQ1085049.1 putative membrane protein [Microbacterium sp. SORGH_AS_0344]MDQ1169674.1 putative membrane protein [Microbacterium proteolyticum]
MTLPVERSRSRRPVTWLTLVGVLLLPAVIGGILVGALYNPTERLGNITAAIVNDDEPVELNGQTVPLGRQLTGGLVSGAADQPSNIDWVISNDDAAAGLADGTYTAVVTIPENFTAASLSTRPGETPERATIDVQTAPDARVVDGAITSQLASTASSVYGSELSSQYLKNVFLGFTSLSDQLGQEAGGARQLADGASQAASGATGLSDGLGQLSDGAGELSGGVGQLATGADQLSGGVGQLAAGAGALSNGVGQLATGADQLAGGATQLSGGIDGLAGGAGQLADGATQLAGGTREAAAGVGQLATGADGIAAGNRQLSDQIGQIADAIPPGFEQAANDVAAAAPQVRAALGTAAADLQRLADSCDQTATPDLCTQLRAASDRANAELPRAQQTVDDIGRVAGQAAELPAGVRAIADANAQLADGAAGLATGARDAESGLNTIAGGIDGLATGATGLRDGARQLGGGAQALGSGASQLAGGLGQTRDGASQLAAGAAGAAGGASQLATGAQTAATGAAGLATGAEDAEDGAARLADGVGQVASGTSALADGLDTAVSQLPTYTDAEATTLADVVADPVSATGASDSLFGLAAVPLLAMAVLWFGGLASFVAFQAVSARALTSRRPSALVALRGFAPAAAVGAAQGLLVAAVVQVASRYEWGDWALFALICIAAGIAFAAVHQALVALFGGAGRWVAAVIGALALGATIVSTVPPALADAAALLPTAPVYDAMLGALSSSGGVAAGVAGLVVWAALSLIVTTLVVVRRRTTSARAAAVTA